ncbi:MAG: hypothetical protein MUF64_06220 [Polyangiaceae bacterium]|nr:hypothetical protein [Polyangiaceae bacterium]
MTPFHPNPTEAGDNIWTTPTTERVLEIIIPRGAATPAQRAEIAAAEQRAAGLANPVHSEAREIP